MTHDQTNVIQISQADDLAAVEAARGLFREYQEALGVDLSFQGFEAELKGLPGGYAPPQGRLLLSYAGGSLAGCVALRPVDADTCEMKRLYVRPQFRADGVGRQLVLRLMDEARAQGYGRMCLDTLPMMDGAQRLYERLGFRDIPAYRHNPIAGSRFLGVEL